MKKIPTPESDLLHQKAEELQRNRPSESTSAHAEAETLRLIHELEVHQEELRMQNEELKLAKERAEYTAEKYKEIYNFTAVNQYALSREGDILELNLAGSQLLRKERDQVLNSKFISFVSEDSRSGFNIFLNQLFNGGEKVTCKVFFELNNGASIYVLLTGVANPKRERCFVTATDITEINQAEIARRKNDERYRTLVSNIPAVTFVLNKKGIFTLSEGKGLAKLGLKPGEVVGMSAFDFYKDYPSVTDAIRKALAGESLRAEITVEGIVFDVVYSPVIDTKGKVTEVIGVANDITERKQAEEAVRETNSKLELAMQLAEMAWWEMDAATGAASFEKRKVEMLGYQPENFKHYKDFMALVHPGDYENTMNAMRSHFDGKLDRYETEYRILTASGEYKWFYDLGSIVNRDSTGKPLTVAGLVMNITDRKNAEEKIRSAHSRLKHFFDSDLIGIVIADASGRLIETNDYYLNMIGFSRADFDAGMIDWRKITPPEWLCVDDQAIRELSEKGKCIPYEKEYIRKDGSLIVVLITDALLPGPDEQIVGFILDITERKRAEKALQESELKYRELIENSPDAILIYSEGKIVLVNKESLHLMHVDDGNDLIGKPVLEFVHPACCDAVKERMKKMAEDGMVLPPYEEVFVRPDGSTVEVEVKAMPVRFEKSKAVQLIIRDITERKLIEKRLTESQKRLNKSQEMAHLGSWELDIENQELIWSDEVYRIFGLQPQEFGATHEAFLESVHPDDRERLNKAYFSSVEEGKDGYQIEHRVIRKHTGEVRHVFEKCEHIRDDSGAIIKSIGMVHDITEHKTAEEKLFESHMLLRIAEESAKIGGWSYTLGEDHVKWSDVLALIHEMPSGYSPLLEEGINFYAPEFREKITQVFTDCVQKGIPYTEEMQIITAKGKRLWIQTIGEALRDENGKIVKVQGAFQDINDRRQSEEEINRMLLLLDIGPSSITVHDFDGKFLYANQRAFELHGYTREEFLALPLEKLDTPETRKLIPVQMKKLAEQGEATFRADHLTKKGTSIPFEVNARITSWGNTHCILSVATDIRERIQAEKKLLESEAHYRLLTEDVTDVVWKQDANNCFTYISPADERLRGYKAREVIGHHVFELFTDEGIESVKALSQQRHTAEFAGIGTGTLTFEVQQRCKNGTLIWTEVVSTAEHDEHGVISGYHGISRDITQRRQAEAELRKSEERNKALIEANPDLMFMFDKNGVFIDFHSSDKVSVFAPSEIFIGKNILDVLPAEVSELTNAKLEEVFATGQMQVYNYQLIVNEQLKDFESRLVLCGNSTALSIVRDITERKQAENELKNSELKFRELFEANSDGIAIFPIYGDNTPEYLVDLNENAARMLGYTKAEMRQLTIDKIEKDRSLEKTGARKQDLLTKGISTFETTLLHKDGHEIEVEIKVMLITFNNQPALMNIVRDITDRKDSEIQLQKYAIELSKQIAEKDKFFSIIAHDLRGPFSGFLELSNMMAEESFNIPVDDMRKMAAVMRKSAANLFRLLGNLLEWSRMQRGITTYNPTSISLNQKILENTALAQEIALKKGIEISYNIPADMVVFADENMLEGILRNLIANAVKYTNAGGSIIVSAKYIAGNNVEFSIKDTGIGMSPAILDNLFNIDVNTNRKGTGGELSTGLGLIICKDFIEKHNSTLRIESEQGKGSTFKFTIPGHITSADGIDPAISLRAETRSDQARKLSILIAEDEETSDLLISISLNKISKEIFHAKTGIEAVNICRSHPGIELIMMDIQMPEIDGYEATRRIRQFNKQVIIIAQTAYTFANDRETAIQAGCNDYISKPISQAELMEVIRKHCK